MLTCCICDDDPKDLERALVMAEDFSRAHPEFSLKIQAFSSGYDLLRHLETMGGFDLYLLDILMPRMAGLELARRIRRRKETSEIIFLTVSPEYALEAFDVSACGYLVKPVEKGKLETALLHAVQRLVRPKDPSLLLKTRDGFRKLPFGDLVVVESFNHDRVCVLADGSKAVTTDTLASLMERLSVDPRFFSPHRAYIINLEHIAALHTDSVLLSNGQSVPVSRSNHLALKQVYLKYLF